jgi:fibro-slime domain-containing protein
MKSIALLVMVAFLTLASPGIAADTITLNTTIRDFSDAHPDFEGPTGFETGIVGPTLGIDGKPVYAGGAGTATTHGATYFDQWYRDVEGVNVSANYDLTLQDSGSGVYRYSSSSFFPIDNQLLGNEGRGHNYHFTLELHSEFTYQAGQDFAFSGDDDLWVFIDDELVIDLGGVHGETSDSVDLDSLGLTAGEIYSFDLFFAERHTVGSNFRIDTSIVLAQPEPPAGIPAPGAMLLCTLGTGLAGLVRRRSR